MSYFTSKLFRMARLGPFSPSFIFMPYSCYWYNTCLLLLVDKHMNLQGIRAPDSNWLYLWIMFHYICGWNASSESLIIYPSISSSDVQPQYPFIIFLGAGYPSERIVYRLLLLYYHILSYQLLPPFIYFFQDPMKYHTNWHNGYCIPFFILWNG